MARWLWVCLIFAATSVSADSLDIYVFKSETCPVCEAQKPWLDKLEQSDPRINMMRMEVVLTREYHDLLREIADHHGVRPGSVPMIFFGGRAWVGDSPSIRTEIINHLRDCRVHDCPNANPRTEKPSDVHHPPLLPDGQSRAQERMIDIPLLGSLDINAQPLLLSTLLIAFVDGFNPCSIWVLTILLALVLHSGSRRRILLVGLTFLLTTATLYGAFIAGLFSILSFATYLPWVYWVVAIFALVFGAVGIKDYFWFKRGFSFSIDDKHKPGIFKGFRDLMTNNNRSTLGLVGATLLMASGIALIELPCTAGFPVIWTGLMTANEIQGAEFFGLLLVYLLVYLGIELVIFIVAVVNMKIGRFSEVQGRRLKLVGGVIMIALALVLIIAPEWMSQVGAALGVFAFAFVFSGLIVVLHQFILPKWGIYIGDRPS